ncbi:MAG: FKBP-type peptidyl-prolyl cis-trans isomerase [Bacteroidota bacterium]
MISNRSYLFLPLIFLLILTGSCSDDPKPINSTQEFTTNKDSLIRMNQNAVKLEDLEIDAFVARYHWNMKKTSTGLRIMIYHPGKGVQASDNKTALIRCETRLLNGNLCYSTLPSMNREIKPGHEATESGLQEGILLMHEGDRAKLIVPSHLAFGLIGDQNKIPPGSPLIYDIELLKLK